MTTRALIFDMDGTMIDSMPCHRDSWIDFAALHGIGMSIDEMMRRTTGRTGAECMQELFGRPIALEESLRLVQQKEALYRKAFAPPVFREVAGFRAFASHARSLELKVGVGTAGDAHNIAFALEHLALEELPHAVVGGDEGLPGKPEPAIFLEVARRLNVAPEHCIVFEDAPLGRAPRRHARGGGVHRPHRRRTRWSARTRCDRPLRWAATSGLVHEADGEQQPC
jgi:beta-phosphoglucomutase-like phosphatase (HAD superfamily)